MTFDATIKENELNMRKDMQQQALEMLDAAGFKDVEGYDRDYAYLEFKRWALPGWEKTQNICFK